MICFPNAKINIGLNVTEKRGDGFHNIESIFYPVDVCDILEVIEGKRETNQQTNIEFSVSGTDIPGNTKDNLCCKAYDLISKDYPLLPVKAHLHKLIPIGAGLGGGSADAAFFIKLLNEKFELGLAWGEMHHYAKQLGSDCSFFIGNRPAFAKGKGDDLESVKLDLSAYDLVLIYPNIHLNTREAYSGVKPKKPKRSIEELIQMPIESWKNNICNDFEDSVFLKYPKIKKIKDQLYTQGAIYASMSGSGSTVYGIFKKNKDFEKEEFGKYSIWKKSF